MSMDKFKELAKNEEFVKELLQKKSAEEARAYLSENGIDLSFDEVKAFGRGLGEILKADGELSEEDLALAAGGDDVRITIPKELMEFGHDIKTTGRIVWTYVEYGAGEAWDWIKSW